MLVKRRVIIILVKMNSKQREQAKIARMVKGMKAAGLVGFVGLNVMLFGNFFTAYQEGQKRGEILHK